MDSGEVLINFIAILDHIDEMVGPKRALTPRAGAARRNVLRRIARATGVIDKAGGATYERLVQRSRFRWPDWIEGCEIQAAGAITALDAEDWPVANWLDQSQIVTGCLLFYLRMNAPHLLPRGCYPTLDTPLTRCEKMAEFKATSFAEDAVPRAD